MSTLRALSAGAWATVVIGVLGFAVSLTFSSQRTGEGLGDSCSTFDLGPFLVGGVGAIFAVLCIVDRDEDGRDPRAETIAAAIGIAFALVHAARGILVITGTTGACS